MNLALSLLYAGERTPYAPALDFIERYPSPSREDIADMLSGHLCRCTGYEPIVEAIFSASREGSA